MKMKTFYVGLMLLLVTALPSAEKPEKIEANLTGYEEVPSVSTPASGRFKATISTDEQTIEYELSYNHLVGTVQQSHIHFAQKAVNGSVVIWLCQTTTTPAPA